jgi:transcriptional regulator with PAS, ATPase and Fis domain
MGRALAESGVATTGSRRAGVLAVAAEPAARRELAAALACEAAVQEVDPVRLGRVGEWVDAAAAVLLLQPALREEDLARLRELPAGRALVLLTPELPEDALEAVITRLRPALVLPHPTPPSALRLALRSVLPIPPPGQGARPQHRRAPALLGVSSAIREVIEQIRHVAATRIPVLILGETGTGKELVARAIHLESLRAERPFVAVNCSALPDTLLEAELFGARRGAFTGADRDRKGLFHEAHGGTLFLDEIGETSPVFQAKLLRAIETREIRRLGESEASQVDVRVVSATHRDLDAAIADGSFRQDLLYRLNTLTIHVPPLRRRRVDIPFLAQHFAEEFGEAHARRIVLDEGFLEALSRHDFPGNVRELRNAVERAIALASEGGAVTAGHLHLAEGAGRPVEIPRHGTLRERLELVEIQAIRQALADHGGNRTRAARELGLSRLGLRQKMRRLGFEPER